MRQAIAGLFASSSKAFNWLPKLLNHLCRAVDIFLELDFLAAAFVS
jgi:hypothetical protein